MALCLVIHGHPRQPPARAHTWSALPRACATFRFWLPTRPVVWYFKIRGLTGRAPPWRCRLGQNRVGYLFARSEPSFVSTVWHSHPRVGVPRPALCRAGEREPGAGDILRNAHGNHSDHDLELLARDIQPPDLSSLRWSRCLQHVPFMAIPLALLRGSREAGRKRSRIGSFSRRPGPLSTGHGHRASRGTPGVLLGASQYSVIPIIQVASLAGVWGVTFVVTMANSVIAWPV